MDITEINNQIKQANKASSAYMKANEFKMAMYHFEERCRLQRLKQKILLV